MLERLRFYLRHSLNDLRVGGRLTFFALLSIAAGVAAVVSLQTLGLMIGDTLVSNLQESNRGDISLRLPIPEDDQEETRALLERAVDEGLVTVRVGGFLFARTSFYYLSEEGVGALRAWLDDRYPGQIEMDYSFAISDPLSRFLGTGAGGAMMVPDSGSEVTQLTPILVSPERYPFYGRVVTMGGASLKERILSPTDVVIDTRVAQALDARIGDSVRIRGSSRDFTVRGIVTTEQEVRDPASSIQVALFGFYYLDNRAIDLFDGVRPQVETLWLKLAQPERVAEIDAALRRDFPFLESTTTGDLEQQNERLSRRIRQLVTIMGLISLLVGSIGIMNTMQVVVRRRTLEIAVLKTVGVRNDQVTVMFLIEALLMGLFGSLAGVVLGWGVTLLLKRIAEVIVAQQLPYRLALGPAMSGLVVGTLIATIFGFLPTLSAGLVRPVLVLRPSENILPRAGLLRIAASLLLVLLAISLVARGILGDFRIAALVTLGAFLAAGLLYLLLLALVWLAGRVLPLLGWVDLKIPMRQMLAVRARAASTLLALVIGVFSLSLITLMADSIRKLLDVGIAEVGGNVLVTAQGERQRQVIEELLREQPGVRSYTVSLLYQAKLLAVEDAGSGRTLSLEDLGVRIARANDREIRRARALGADVDAERVTQQILERLAGLEVRAADQLPQDAPASGRRLTAADSGRPVTLLRGNDAVKRAGFQVGDRLRFQLDDTQLTLEVVGILAGGSNQFDFGQPAFLVPEGLLSEPAAQLQVWADVEKDAIPELRRRVGSLRGVFLLETSVFTRLLEELLRVFTAFPSLVAALGLIVGGVVIANSVVLSTLERRREIAVMKALGLQRERVLLMLLLENGIMGFLGGLVGVGIGLAVLFVLLASGGSLLALPLGTALLLMLLCVGVAVLAALSAAWEASGEKPLNVLRYE